MSIGVPGVLRRDSTAVIAITGAVTGEKITAAGPLRVRRVGAEITVATSGTDAIVTVQSVTGVTATSLGTFTIPDLTAGNGAYRNFDDFPLVPEGSYLAINLTTAAGTGSGLLWVEYEALPWSQAGLATLSAVTS